jgi:hypothetical protein
VDVVEALPVAALAESCAAACAEAKMLSNRASRWRVIAMAHSHSHDFGLSGLYLTRDGCDGHRSFKVGVGGSVCRRARAS